MREGAHCLTTEQALQILPLLLQFRSGSSSDAVKAAPYTVLNLHTRIVQNSKYKVGVYVFAGVATVGRARVVKILTTR
jgi:hypothetical protein